MEKKEERKEDPCSKPESTLTIAHANELLNGKTKVIVAHVKKLLHEVENTRDRENKMVIVREIYHYMLIHRDFVYAHKTFYQTVLKKLIEFIDGNYCLLFTEDCLEFLRNLYCNNTAPNYALNLEISKRIHTLLFSQNYIAS